MKKLFIIAVLVFNILQTAYCMIPGPALLAECPKCGEEKELMSIISGNTVGATQWSDMYLEAPMLPQLSPVQKCESCSTYFLLSQSKKRHGAGDEASSSFETGQLTFKEMKEALSLLNDESLTDEDELKIRFEFLHRYNDVFRFDQKEYNISKEEFERSRSEEDVKLHKDNLLGLIALLDSTNSEELPIIAELYREAGDFDRSLSLLEAYKPTSDIMELFVSKVVKNSEEKNDRVFLIY